MSDLNKTFVAIDDGSSAIKVAVEGNTFEFDSIVKQGVSFYKFKTSDASYDVLGEDFAVVSDTDKRIDTSTSEYQTSEVNRVLVHEAIRRSGVEGDITVGVTIPLARFYNSDNSINTKLIEEKKNNVLASINNKNGYNKYNIANVEVFPEGALGYYHAESEFGLDGYVMCIDIGGYTTDISVFTKEGMGDCVTIENGTIDCINELSKLIKKRNGYEKIPFSVAANALISGEFDGKKINVECEEIIKKIIAKALKAAKNLGAFESCKSIVFIGGGARFVEKYYPNKNGNMYIPKQPQMANVNGLLRFLKEGV